MFQNINHSLSEWDKLLNHIENKDPHTYPEKNKGEALLRLYK